MHPEPTSRLTTVLWCAAACVLIYPLSYVALVKRAPGAVYNDFSKNTAEPALRFDRYPWNVNTKFLLIYKPLIQLDQTIRPAAWKGRDIGKLSYE